MNRSEILILTIGFGGQTLFFMRFLVQWLYSEKHKRSLIPISFWYLSIGGSLLLLVYALIRKDIVFIVGQSTGIIIYLRNLMLLSREKQLQRVSPSEQTRSTA